MKAPKLLKKNQAGFTLIELMIVVAIVGILAAIAAPQYQKYMLKSKFTEVVNATGTFKSAVEVCAQDLRTLTGCNAGTNGIPASITTSPSKYVAKVEVADGGAITATATSVEGLNGETYILTPSYSSTTNTVTWKSEGTSTTTGLAKGADGAPAA